MPFTLPQLHLSLKVWERIELVVGEDTNPGRYVARIEDFIDEGIVISNPEFIRGGTLLRENIELIVMVNRDDAAYQFQSRIRKIKTSFEETYLLAFPVTAKRVQRRQFVRVEQFAKVSYVNLTKNKQELDYDNEAIWQEASVVNVSGGGMLVRVTEALTAQDLLLLKIGFLGDIGLPKIVAGICRRSFHHRDKLFTGIEFLRSDRLSQYFSQQEMRTLPRSVKRFNQMAQNKLVTYVFQEQIELRKKGLL